MKKHILKLGFALAVVVAAGYTVYSSQTSLKMTGIALNNVEALASGESGSGVVQCCPDPGDTCVVNGGIFRDQDECVR